jgi:hypothetical protein
MIAFYRTVAIAPGKLESSVAFAKEVAAFITTKTGVELLVAMPIGGNPNRLGWSARYESLADFDAMMTGLMTDPAYLELLRNSADNFIPGSVHDELWRVI